MEDNVNAIQRLHSSESARKILLELDVGKSTMKDCKKNQREIEQWCSNQPSEGKVVRLIKP